MNRAELIRMRELFTVMAKACKDSLDAEARLEWEENESRSSWETPEGLSAYASISQPGLVVEDHDRFMEWLAANFPTEVVQVPTVRNTEWLRVMRDSWAQLAGKTGTTPPGTKLDAGGAYLHVSVRGGSPVRRELGKLATEMLAGGVDVWHEELLEALRSATRDLYNVALSRTQES